MDTILSIIEDKLYCEVTNEKNREINYILKHNGKPICETGFVINNPYVWPISETGFYEATVFIKKDGKTVRGQSPTLQFFSKQDKVRYQNFLESTYVKPESINLHRYNYPFQDFCLIYLMKANQYTHILRKFCRTEDFYYNVLFNGKRKSCILISSRPIKKANKSQFLFSGITRNHERLLFGDQEITDLDEILEQIGEFTLVDIKKDKVDIRTDYFGVGKLVYFESDNMFVITNKYHLMLMLLNRMSIKLSLNYKRVIANFCHLQQNFQQSFTALMDIENIKLLPADCFVSIDKKNWHIHKTSLYRDILNPGNLSDQMYEDLLYKAKDELIDNARSR